MLQGGIPLNVSSDISKAYSQRVQITLCEMYCIQMFAVFYRADLNLLIPLYRSGVMIYY